MRVTHLQGDTPRLHSGGTVITILKFVTKQQAIIYNLVFLRDSFRATSFFQW